MWRKKHLPVFEENKDYSVKSSSSTSQVLVGGLVDTPDFPIFSFNSVALATGNFAEENKLGQGGFGTVYKVKHWNITSSNLIETNVGDKVLILI